MIKLQISVFELEIGVFRNGDFPKSYKHQSPIQNNQLVILSPIGDYHFNSIGYLKYPIEDIIPNWVFSSVSPLIITDIAWNG